MSRMFVFGLGYSAMTLARRLRPQGWQVAGTVRSAQKAAALQAEGIAASVFDGAPTKVLPPGLAEADHVLVSVPPGETGDPALNVFGAAIARRGGGLRWLGYLSTVGVYGDRGGAWVTESDIPSPASPRSQRRLLAEEGWRELGRVSGFPVMVFRIAGIYGPGRNALVQLKAGIAHRIVKPGQMFNRIHVADIAGALEASIATPQADAIYNLSDDLPCPPQDVVTYAAGLLGCEPPPEIDFEAAGLSPMAASFYSENKRVSNEATKRALGLTLAFPDYRAGLDSLYEAGEGR